MIEDYRHLLSPDLNQIDRAELLERICVRPPYFALQDMHAGHGTFWSTATAQRPVSLERGPMQACEISRHAAICGLSAAALTFEDSDRRYYLAQDASYVGVVNPAPYGATVAFEARLHEKNKRQAIADITATAGGLALAELRVTYTILNEASFRRLFRSRYSASAAFSGFQRAQMPDPPTGKLRRCGETLTLTLDCVPEEACAGHFEYYPAMPVAVLMGQLGLVAGHHYSAPYRVERATMSASDFCWAGESADFEVTPQADAGHYACRAYASGAVVSEMELTLAASV